VASKGGGPIQAWASLPAVENLKLMAKSRVFKDQRLSGSQWREEYV
jgi:hypothetical protein